MGNAEAEFRRQLAIAQGNTGYATSADDFIGQWADQFAWQMPLGVNPGTQPYGHRKEVARRLITQMLADLQVRGK